MSLVTLRPIAIGPMAIGRAQGGACHLSLVTCHLSLVTCHMSLVTCNMSLSIRIHLHIDSTYSTLPSSMPLGR